MQGYWVVSIEDGRRGRGYFLVLNVVDSNVRIKFVDRDMYS